MNILLLLLTGNSLCYFIANFIHESLQIKHKIGRHFCLTCLILTAQRTSLFCTSEEKGNCFILMTKVPLAVLTEKRKKNVISCSLPFALLIPYEYFNNLTLLDDLIYTSHFSDCSTKYMNIFGCLNKKCLFHVVEKINYG